MVNRKPNATTPARRFPTTIVILFAVLVVAGGLWWGNSRTVGAPASSNSSTTARATNAPAANETPSSFEKLTGRWRRADGGYIVEIRSVQPGGKLDAVYFNPRPINVGKAEASKDGENVNVFIELQDVNYQGSAYTLTYQPATDRLAGTYFHAGSGQNLDVLFSRVAGP